MKTFKGDRLSFCEFCVLPFLLYIIALLDLGKNPHRAWRAGDFPGPGAGAGASVFPGEPVGAGDSGVCVCWRWRQRQCKDRGLEVLEGEDV